MSFAIAVHKALHITVLLPQVLMPVSYITVQVPLNYSTVIFV